MENYVIYRFYKATEASAATQKVNICLCDLLKWNMASAHESW